MIQFRKKRKTAAGFSLFSFIDILAGMIGAISLIIIGVSLSQIIPESSSLNPLSDDISKLKILAQRKNREIADLEIDIDKIREQQNKNEDARIRIVNLSVEANKAIEQNTQMSQLFLKNQRSRENINSLQVVHQKLATHVEQLEQAVATGKLRDIQDKIEIHFRGSRKDLKPHFVECTNIGLIIHQAGQKESVYWRNIPVSDTFTQLLSRVKKTAGATVIFLIRPDGLKSFKLAIEQAQKKQIRNGKLPIPGQGELDFGKYGNQEGPNAF